MSTFGLVMIGLQSVTSIYLVVIKFLEVKKRILRLR